MQLSTINNIIILYNQIVRSREAANTLIKGKTMATSPKSDTRQKIKVNHALQEPPLYRIIYINDDVTTMEFVVTSLIEYFNYNPDTASQLTKDIHDNGSAIVAVLPYEIAEQKGIEVTLDARQHGYPLQVKVEAEK